MGRLLKAGEIKSLTVEGLVGRKPTLLLGSKSNERWFEIQLVLGY